MNAAFSNKLPAADDKSISGDGDGIKQTSVIRYPVPASRKFTPTVRKTKDMKSKLELALKEMKSPNKKQGLRRKLITECSSVDTPIRIPNRKCLESTENNDKIGIYCSPRGIPLTEKFPEGAARLVLRYLLLNSWRKSRSRYNDLSSLLAVKEDKINQLCMQIDVLQNLRKSESSKREGVALKYHEIQKDFDVMAQDNIALKNHIEGLERDKLSILTEMREMKEKILNYKQELKEKNDSLNTITEKFQKEREKLKKSSIEKKNAQEQNYKLENVINIQKENLENLKSCVETLQKSKLDLNSKFEKSQENCKQHSENIRAFVAENARNKSKIFTYEIEREELSRELRALRNQLETALREYDELKNENVSIQEKIQDLTIQFEEERRYLWNFMRKGIFSTYSVLKYLAEKIVPALQANFTY